MNETLDKYNRHDYKSAIQWELKKGDDINYIDCYAQDNELYLTVYDECHGYHIIYINVNTLIEAINEARKRFFVTDNSNKQLKRIRIITTE